MRFGQVSTTSSAKQRRLPLVGIALACAWLVGCQGQVGPAGLFEVVAKDSGFVFVHSNGATGGLHLPEVTTGGAALLDFDRDGDVDVYFVQGGERREGDLWQGACDVLLRNDLVGEGLQFVDVSEEMGLGCRSGYGMGAAAGDFDRDGWVDLYVTEIGGNRLLRNDEGERFVDVTSSVGASDPSWSTSAAWLDVNRDGWLDLYVANYVDYDWDRTQPCRSPSGRSEYCGPQVFPAQSDRLFLNRGGRFEDVSETFGVSDVASQGLGVAAIDVNQDGWMDIYVANDRQPNQLWMGSEDSVLREEAATRGAAVSLMGFPEASMGIATGDVDADGDSDIVLTHLRSETHTVYLNDGDGFFVDGTSQTGLGAQTLAATGFGAALVDVNGDALPDLVAANGDVTRHGRASDEEGHFHGDYGQRNQLFLNEGGTFTAASEESAGAGFVRSEVTRALVTGDLDNDGGVDLLFVNSGGEARLVLGRSPVNWVGFDVVDESGAPALGAVVQVRLTQGIRTGVVRSDGSFLSSHDPRVLLTLASATGVEAVTIEWPSLQLPRRETFEVTETRRYHLLRRGAGERP